MNKILILVSLLGSFNIWANPIGIVSVQGFVLDDGTKIFINKEIEKIVLDQHKQVEAIELRSGQIVDPIEVKSIIAAKSLGELSGLMSGSSGFDMVLGGDGSGGG